jgi:hypothetical protein
MGKLVAACLALGMVSLLLPSEPSYDPWAWLVWGRELTQLELDTAGGPSWKPLPVVLAALTAPLGELDRALPPAVWMVVARAGALLAAALAFRLARRLAGGGRAGTAAGISAAVALLALPRWFELSAQGSEAPLAVAFMLWAVERHLDERRDQALLLGMLACLLRPELFPFLLAYAALVWWSEPRRRPLVAGVVLLLPLAWLVPEWIGAGDPLDGGEQARSEPYWSLSHADSPWLAALGRVHDHAGAALELAVLAAVAAAAARRNPVVLALAAAVLAEVALFVAMTQAGFSGNARYVLPALAVGCVLAGVGIGELLRLRPAGVPRMAAPLLALAALAALALPAVPARVERLRVDAREVRTRMELHRDLVTAVERVGGPVAVNRLGPPSVNRALQTRLAWELERPIDELERAGGEGMLFESSLALAGRPAAGVNAPKLSLARVGSWRVYRRQPLYTAFAGI